MADRLSEIRQWLGSHPNHAELLADTDDIAYLLEVADAARAVAGIVGLDWFGNCGYCMEPVNNHAADCPWLRLRGLLEGEQSEFAIAWSARPVEPSDLLYTYQTVVIPEDGVWRIDIVIAPDGLRHCRLRRLGPLPEGEPEPTLEDVIGAPERIAEAADRFSAWARKQLEGEHERA